MRVNKEWRVDTEKIKIMIELQKKLDETIGGNPTPKQKLYAFIIEFLEVIELIPYKWWKEESFNEDKIIAELVDCLHFSLSFDISLNKKIEDMSEILTTQDVYYGNYDIKQELMEQLKDFLSDYSHEKITFKHLVLTQSLLTIITIIFGLERVFEIFDKMYKKYIGKNGLNLFRQKYNYGDKLYILKNSKKDNAALDYVLKFIDADELTPERVVKELEDYAFKKGRYS